MRYLISNISKRSHPISKEDLRDEALGLCRQHDGTRGKVFLERLPLVAHDELHANTMR